MLKHRCSKCPLSLRQSDVTVDYQHVLWMWASLIKLGDWCGLALVQLKVAKGVAQRQAGKLLGHDRCLESTTACHFIPPASVCRSGFPERPSVSCGDARIMKPGRQRLHSQVPHRTDPRAFDFLAAWSPTYVCNIRCKQGLCALRAFARKPATKSGRDCSLCVGHRFRSRRSAGNARTEIFSSFA